MFNELLPLLKPGSADTVLITVSRLDADKLQLTITPRLDNTDGENSKLLNTPIQLTGTADELDVDLVQYLKPHAVKVAGLRTTFAVLDEQLAALEKSGRSKVDAAKAGATTTPAAPEKPAEALLF